MTALPFTVFGVVVVLALILLSAFFSSSETAIFTLPEGWSAGEEAGDGGSRHSGTCGATPTGSS